MVEWVLIAWLVAGSAAEPIEVGTYRQQDRCLTAAESMTEPNPEDGSSPYIIAKCVERDRK